MSGSVPRPGGRAPVLHLSDRSAAAREAIDHLAEEIVAGDETTLISRYVGALHEEGVETLHVIATLFGARADRYADRRGLYDAAARKVSRLIERVAAGLVAAGEALPEACADCRVRGDTLCATLPPGDLVALSAGARRLVAHAHQPVFGADTPADHVYVLTAGMVKLFKLLPDGRRQIIDFRDPGDVLGLTRPGENGLQAEAVMQSALCRFSRARLDRVLEHVPALHGRLMVLAAEELTAAHEHMVLLGRKTARERLCSFLLARHARQPRRDGDGAGWCLTLPMSRADIADYLGLTTETVSRTMTQLKTSGLIRLMDGHSVELRDPTALRRIAEAEGEG